MKVELIYKSALDKDIVRCFDLISEKQGFCYAIHLLYCAMTLTFTFCFVQQ